MRVDISSLLPPAERSRLLATHARSARDALIREGRAAPTFQTFVDGREGIPEERVRPDGAILYVFSALARAASFAQSFLVGASPVARADGGLFRRSWIVVVDGVRWQRDLAAVPPGAVVHILNTTDYARRLEVGRRRRPGLGFKLIEKARQELQRRYPDLVVERRFLDWPGAYVLRGGGRVAAKANNRSSVFRAGGAFLSRRKDRVAGQRITTPALEFRSKR